MPTNVRIAQIGQTAVNRPIHEVVVNGRHYCFATDENNRAGFKSRAWMQAIGFCSVVCATFEDQLRAEVSLPLELDSNGTVDRAKRFSAQTLGTGLAFVSDWSPIKGWVNLFPAGALSYNL